MRVLLFSKYGPRGASSRQRSYQYLPFLAKEGISVDISTLFDNRYLELFFSGGKRNPFQVLRSYLNRARRIASLSSYDLLWIEYELFPWIPAFVENRICRRWVPFIVDYDDAVFHRYDLNPSRLVRKLLGPKIDRIMRSADIVIAGNRYLAQRALAAGASRVVQIPTVVDLTRYRCRSHRRESDFTIGWIGTPHTARYLKQIEPAIQEIASRHRIQFVAVGAGELSLRGVSCKVPAWSEENEAESIAAFDVGVMPLRDEPFERGKCGYKLIQYMACGVPVIASPVGANMEIVDPGCNGFLAENQNQWFEAIEFLVRNPAKAAAMGLEGRRKVELHYSLHEMAPKLSAVIRSAGQSRGGE